MRTIVTATVFSVKIGTMFKSTTNSTIVVVVVVVVVIVPCDLTVYVVESTGGYFECSYPPCLEELHPSHMTEVAGVGEYGVQALDSSGEGTTCRFHTVGYVIIRDTAQ